MKELKKSYNEGLCDLFLQNIIRVIKSVRMWAENSACMGEGSYRHAVSR
jgi:hypothetical protein